MSFDRLIEKIESCQNPTVAGLDPTLAYIPDAIKADAYREHGQNAKGAAAAFFMFNKGLIDALCDIVPAIKPQSAYYEAMGWAGVKAFADTIAYAKAKGMVIIADCKRNDIGSTMEAYAKAYLGATDVEGEREEAFGADYLTVNGYLGTDGIAPLLTLCQSEDKGIFVLVKTSNPSSGELQDKMIDGRSIYRFMGDMCETWGQHTIGRHGYSAVGAVVGATYPAQLGELRAALPHTFFLVPGYGAQGAGAADIVPAFDTAGKGAVINSSRAIMTAWQKEGCFPDDYAAAARREAVRMRDEIKAALAAR